MDYQIKTVFLCQFDLATSILISTIDIKNKEFNDCLNEFNELTEKVFKVGANALLQAKVREDFKV